MVTLLENTQILGTGDKSCNKPEDVMIDFRIISLTSTQELPLNDKGYNATWRMKVDGQWIISTIEMCRKTQTVLVG